MNDTIKNRCDFVLVFDVKDGNPNGDPDAGNLPRVDPETMHGLVTDVCLKRKLRDYVDATRGGEERFKIYVEHRGVLNNQHERAYTALGLTSKGTKESRETIDQTRAWMCENFFDIRTFGAVMTTGRNCGQVRGPLQLTFARSIDPVVPLDVSITRVAVTKAEDAVRFDEGEEKAKGKETEMGRKALVPYGLYRAHGFFNARLATGTGFDAADLALVWAALENMWDLDRSASRGMMACRGLYVFSHNCALGCAPAHRLFDTITVTRIDPARPVRQFADYQVAVDDSRLPDGVTLARLVD